MLHGTTEATSSPSRHYVNAVRDHPADDSVRTSKRCQVGTLRGRRVAISPCALQALQIRTFVLGVRRHSAVQT
jgi:hypothetical protein